MVVKIEVTPKSSKNEIIGIKDGLLRIKVTSPPVEGAANETVIKLLFKELGLKKHKLLLLADKSQGLKLFN